MSTYRYQGFMDRGSMDHTAGGGDGSVEMSFTRSLKEFVAVDDEIKRVSQEAKELRKNKRVLENAISLHMINNELDEGRVDTSALRVVQKKKTTNAYTRANVSECALTLFGSESAEKLLCMIDDMKQTKESHGIKRVRAN